MMPKLPPPIADDDFGYPVWGEAQLLAYGKAIAEACAVLAESGSQSVRSGIIAFAIREAAKEVGK